MTPLPSAPIAAQSRLVKASVHSGGGQLESAVADSDSLVGPGGHSAATAVPIGPGGTQATSTDSAGGRAVGATVLGVVDVVTGAAIEVGVTTGAAIEVGVTTGAAIEVGVVEGAAVETGMGTVGDGGRTSAAHALANSTASTDAHVRILGMRPLSPT